MKFLPVHTEFEKKNVDNFCILYIIYTYYFHIDKSIAFGGFFVDVEPSYSQQSQKKFWNIRAHLHLIVQKKKSILHSITPQI